MLGDTGGFPLLLLLLRPPAPPPPPPTHTPPSLPLRFFPLLRVLFKKKKWEQRKACGLSRGKMEKKNTPVPLYVSSVLPCGFVCVCVCECVCMRVRGVYIDEYLQALQAGLSLSHTHTRVRGDVYKGVSAGIAGTQISLSLSLSRTHTHTRWH
jgi:hypothetical protein